MFSNQVKEWTNTYESLAALVVPRSSTKITQDDEYTLFNVVVFKKTKEDFSHKCRERKFIVRDFVFDETEIEKSRLDTQQLEQQEKELWVSWLLSFMRPSIFDIQSC